MLFNSKANCKLFREWKANEIEKSHHLVETSTLVKEYALVILMVVGVSVWY